MLDVLAADGYRVVGPVVRNGVIAYDDLTTEAEMPVGCSVEQSPGRWRLHHGTDSSRFSWTPGADSWKRFVFPARQEVLRIRRTDGSWTTTGPTPPDRPLALIGARDCEVRALSILDRVLLEPDQRDPEMFLANTFGYSQRRTLAEHAYQRTRADLRSRRSVISVTLARHGLTLDDAVLDDHRRVLAVIRYLATS